MPTGGAGVGRWRTLGRGLRTSLLALGLLLTGSGVASAARVQTPALGGLSYVGCVKSTGTWEDCGAAATGLAQPDALATSPDGKSIYVASIGSSTLTSLRHVSGGPPAFQGCVGEPGSGAPCSPEPGLREPVAVAVSPDGRNVYVASSGSGTVTVLARAVGGQLHFVGCVAGAGAGSQGICGRRSPDLLTPTALAVSPDGRYLYVTSAANDNLVSFARGAGGSLAQSGCVALASTPQPCGSQTDQLDVPRGVALTRDGRDLYVVANQTGALAHFSRDPSSGALRARGCFASIGARDEPCTQFAPALNRASAVAIAPDGTSVYVTAAADAAVSLFARDPGTGDLRYRDCVALTGRSKCVKTAGALGAPADVAVSPDGRTVAVAGGTDGAVVTLARNAASGELGASSCLAETGQDSIGCPEAAGIADPQALAFSPDGTALYVAGYNSLALGAFEALPGGRGARRHPRRSHRRRHQRRHRRGHRRSHPLRDAARHRPRRPSGPRSTLVR